MPSNLFSPLASHPEIMSTPEALAADNRCSKATSHIRPSQVCSEYDSQIVVFARAIGNSQEMSPTRQFSGACFRFLLNNVLYLVRCRQEGKQVFKRIRLFIPRLRKQERLRSCRSRLPAPALLSRPASVAYPLVAGSLEHIGLEIVHHSSALVGGDLGIRHLSNLSGPPE